MKNIWLKGIALVGFLGATSLLFAPVLEAQNFSGPTVTVPVPISQGGTGATTAAGARIALGLGTMATQNSNAVAITGGTGTGLTSWSSGTLTGTTSVITPTVTTASGALNLSPNSLAATIVNSNQLKLAGSSNPVIVYTDSSVGTDLKTWQLYDINTNYCIYAANDAQAASTQAYCINRGTGANAYGILNHTFGVSTASGTSINSLVLTAADAAFIGTITKPGGTSPLLTTNSAITSGAAAQAGTLLNSPVAGNPTKWAPFNDNGTTRYLPLW